MHEGEWLSPIVCEPAALKREASTRRKPYEEISIPKGGTKEHGDEGWEVVRELKRRVVLRRQRPHDERLEDRVWYLLYLLGYRELSMGRNFRVRIERKGSEPVWRQIDVLAKDDETVVVAMCRSSAQVVRRSLQEDIEEFSSLKGPIAKAVHSHYGRLGRPKFVWLLVTANIVWSELDRQRVAGARINVVTERELRYYRQLADHLHSAARFQFLAEFLKDQQIPEMENVRVPAVRGKLGPYTFYSFVSTPKQLLKIAFVNHRSLNDPEGAPTYQRLVSRARLHQIGRFLNGGGFFPTNILVNFTRECRFELIASDEDTKVAFGHLYLPSRYRSAWIIDGQHRLYGYAFASAPELEQNIMVVAFENLDKAEEANLFVTINHEQKSVPKTLLDDLEGDLKWGSNRPAERIGAISARLINLLNTDIGEPLYGRVTQQGIPATELICLTVPELKGGLRRSGLLGAVVGGNEYSPGPLSGLSDSATLDRARAFLNAYFETVATANRKLWELGRLGLLCTNIALQAHFQLIAALLDYAEMEKGLAARKLDPLELVVEIQDYLAPILNWLRAASPAQMAHEFKVQFGSGGPREYFFRLCRLVSSQFPSFRPDGYAEWIDAQSQERVEEADRRLKEINIMVQKCIFDSFKELYGLGRDAYFTKGVLDNEIKARAYKKSLEDKDDDRLALEHYLDFIEYKKIVENGTHWPLFRAVFDIQESGQKKRARNLRWMERVNELRRIPAHPTESRRYKVEDFDYIALIYEELRRRLSEQGTQGVAS